MPRQPRYELITVPQHVIQRGNNRGNPRSSPRRLYRRSGALGEGRYKASLVNCERYVLRYSRYIEINPVRAGMVLEPADYRWSSYRRNAGGGADAVVADHAEYTALRGSLAARCEAYRELFRVDLDAEVLGESVIISTSVERWNRNALRTRSRQHCPERYVLAGPGDRGRRLKNARLIS